MARGRLGILMPHDGRDDELRERVVEILLRRL